MDSTLMHSANFMKYSNYLSYFLLILSSFLVKAQSRKDSLLVFVGQKIEIKKFSPQVKKNTFLMDEAFKAKYKIIQNVYGKYQSDTIEFEVYDHYGVPSFAQYDFVLLFVSVENGKLFHEKYQYFDVYKTKNGRWASSYKKQEYEHEYNQHTNIKPELIDFSQEVSYNVQNYTKQNRSNYFPLPYYKIIDNKAIAIYGNYVEQLFELKKNGILKARGIF